jgi:hypothetical protein
MATVIHGKFSSYKSLICRYYNEGTTNLSAETMAARTFDNFN